jgi:hypothetical protein
VWALDYQFDQTTDGKILEDAQRRGTGTPATANALRD